MSGAPRHGERRCQLPRPRQPDEPALDRSRTGEGPPRLPAQPTGSGGRVVAAQGRQHRRQDRPLRSECRRSRTRLSRLAGLPGGPGGGGDGTGRLWLQDRLPRQIRSPRRRVSHQAPVWAAAGLTPPATQSSPVVRAGGHRPSPPVFQSGRQSASQSVRSVPGGQTDPSSLESLKGHHPLAVSSARP